MVTCGNCGAENIAESKYCRQCGHSLDPLEIETRRLDASADANPDIGVQNPIEHGEGPTVRSTSGGAAGSATEDAGRAGPPGTGENEARTRLLETTPLPSAFATTAPIPAKSVLDAMPTLKYLAIKKRDTLGAVLDNYRFIFILHFLSDLIGFMEAFRMVGMSWENAHFLFKRYMYPHKERIANQLSGYKADVVPLVPGPVLKTIVGNIIAESKNDGKKIIVVEDGGYIVPLIHREFISDVDYFVGAVEQTTKGLNEDLEVVPLRFPVLSVASARIKREKESPEIAKAVWENVVRLLWNRDLRSPTVLIVGYGSIGFHLADHLRRLGARVKVFDSQADRRAEASAAGFEVADEMRGLITREPGLIVIGATGRTSISKREILALENNAVLVSASSDQHEIGLAELQLRCDEVRPVYHPATGEKTGDIYKVRNTNSEVTLLAEGYPVNFWKAESLPFRISQVALVPIYLSALALATRRGELRVGEPDAEFVDRLIDEEDIEDEL